MGQDSPSIDKAGYTHSGGAMRSALITLVFLPFALVHWSVHAQIYMCKDASGRTLTSDRPIPECADRSMRELDKQGRTRREIKPPMSAEEKRQLQLEEERRKAEEAAADERRREDRLLKARYRNEADVELARKRALEVVEEQARRERSSLAAAEKQQRKTQSEIDALKKKNVPVSKALQQRLDEDTNAVDSAMKKIQEYDAETAQINARFDATLRRYRELTGMQATN